jgi:hypothetical protein
MKFASAARAGGREGMRERQRRERLATPALRAHYPGLNALQLGFDFSDNSDFVPSPQVTVFHPPAPAYFRFACPYSDCDGEFNLTQPIDLAVSSHDARAGGEVRCGGMRHRGIACTLRLEYSISPQWP